jgi:transcription antitermination factor NusG
VDRRDETTWIAVELTKAGELKIEDGTLASAIRRDLGVESTFPLFIPSTTYKKGGKTITVHLMEGYCFIASGLPEVKYFKLEKQPYVESVMSTVGGPHKMRTLSVIPNRDIEKLKKQLQDQLASDIEENAWVKVVRGKFKGLEGRVLTLLDERHAWVQFELRSLHRVTPIPRVFLETIEPPAT